MALMHTPEKDSNFYAPDFTLKNIDDKMVAWNDCTGENGTLVMFICNHCPYVKAIVERMVADCNALQGKGIGCVAIMPNDTQNYPADSFENMKIFATDNSFTFPYLIDETQEVAKAYDAVCTPDFFGFNAGGRLEYRGRLDSAAAGEADDSTIRELRDAMLQIAESGTGPATQKSSMGCSIKWR